MSILFASLITVTLTPAILFALLALLGSEQERGMEQRVAVARKSQRNLRPPAGDLD